MTLLLLFLSLPVVTVIKNSTVCACVCECERVSERQRERWRQDESTSIDRIGPALSSSVLRLVLGLFAGACFLPCLINRVETSR